MGQICQTGCEISDDQPVLNINQRRPMTPVKVGTNAGEDDSVPIKDRDEFIEQRNTDIEKFLDDKGSENHGKIKQINSIMDFKAEYKRRKMLGYGNWGEVNSYIHKRTGVLCAAKIVLKKYINKKGTQAVENMRRELETLDNISHPHIVRIMQLLEGQKQFYIVMEYLEGGNLKEYMLI